MNGSLTNKYLYQSEPDFHALKCTFKYSKLKKKENSIVRFFYSNIIK